MNQLNQIKQIKQTQPKQCIYCKSTIGCIQCQCGQYFCNGTIENQNICQLFYHMRENEHYSIKIHGKPLQCCSCEETNIYNLRVHQSEKKVKCTFCLESSSKKERECYLESIYNEGKFTMKPFRIQQSQMKVTQKKINEIENKIPQKKKLLKIKGTYDSIDEYCSLFKQINEIESKEKVNVIEMEFHRNRQRISYSENGETRTFTLQLDRSIKGLTEDDDVIICCGGMRGMIHDSKSNQVRQHAKTLFQTSKCTMGAKVKNPQSKKLILEVDDSFFANEMILATGGKRERYPTSKTERWKWNKEIINQTQLFRIYFLTTEKVDSLNKTLNMFEKRPDGCSH